MKIQGIDFRVSPDLVTLDGNQLFAVKYDSKHSGLFLSYKSLEASLTECKNSISFIIRKRNDRSDPDIQSCIIAHYRSLIISYARCFVQGKVKLEDRIVPKKFIRLHEEMMDLRHKQIAHSASAREVPYNLIALYPNFENKRIVDVLLPQYFEHQPMNSELLNPLDSLIDELIGFVREKLKTHYKILSDEIRSMDIGDLYRPLEEMGMMECNASPNIVDSDARNYPVRVDSTGKVTFTGVSLRLPSKK